MGRMEGKRASYRNCASPRPRLGCIDFGEILEQWEKHALEASGEEGKMIACASFETYC